MRTIIEGVIRLLSLLRIVIFVGNPLFSNFIQKQISDPPKGGPTLKQSFNYNNLFTWPRVNFFLSFIS